MDMMPAPSAGGASAGLAALPEPWMLDLRADFLVDKLALSSARLLSFALAGLISWLLAPSPRLGCSAAAAGGAPTSCVRLERCDASSAGTNKSVC